MSRGTTPYFSGSPNTLLFEFATNLCENLVHTKSGMAAAAAKAAAKAAAAAGKVGPAVLLIGREHVCHFIKRSLGPRPYTVVGWSYLKGGKPQPRSTLDAKLLGTYPGGLSAVVLGGGLPSEAVASEIASYASAAVPTARVECRPPASEEDRAAYAGAKARGELRDPEFRELTSRVGPWATVAFMDALFEEMARDAAGLTPSGGGGGNTVGDALVTEESVGRHPK